MFLSEVGLGSGRAGRRGGVDGLDLGQGDDGVADQTAQLVSSQMAFGASGLVGRTVSWTSADGTAQTGRVSGVTFGTDGPMLDVAGTRISMGQVQSITDGTATPATPTATPAGSTTGTTTTA